MLDRKVVKDFLEERLKELVVKIPKRIKKKDLVETFCLYTEDDYYDWLKDNFKSFFNHGNPDWEWIKRRIELYQSEAEPRQKHEWQKYK